MYEYLQFYISMLVIFLMNIEKIWIFGINMFFMILYVIMMLSLILFVSIMLLYTKRKIMRKIKMI